MTRTSYGKLLTAIGAILLVPAGLAGTALAGTEAAAAPHGTISTVIGGPGGPDPATSVSVGPCALRVSGGNLYFSSSYQTVVDKVSQSTGLLTSIAGDGVGSLGSPAPADGTPAPAASLGAACGLTVDSAGNILVADGAQVLAVAGKTGTFYGKKMTAGRVYTVVKGLSGVQDANGAIAQGAVDVQLDAAGNLVIAVAGEAADHTDPEGDSRVLVLAERAGTFYGKSMVKGKLYVVGGSLDGYKLGNAVPATQADLGTGIGTVRLDSAGNVVIADTAGGGSGGPDSRGPQVAPQVRVIASRAGTFYGQPMKAGFIYTIAGNGALTGNGVPAPQASLQGAFGVALDHAGNVLVAAETVRVIAVANGTFYGQKMTAGRIYTLSGFAGASTNATGVAVDSAGNVLVARAFAWDIQLLAERTGSYYGKSVHAGQVYSIAGNGRLGYSGDGGPATSAEIAPSAVATVRSGDMTAVADTSASVVRVVPGQTGVFFGRSMRAGFIYTVASGLGSPVAVAFDPAGNLLIADRRTHLVRVVACTTATFYGQQMTAGHIYTIAGGGTDQLTSGVPASTAEFEGPTAVTTDAAGNVLIIDNNGYESTTWARVVAAKTGRFYGQHMIAGDIYTVAGDGSYGQSGDGGPATAASIESQGIAVDGSGNIVLADQTRARVVAGKTGTFYGQKMTAGYIYTVAGGGTQTSDGTPALQANFGAGLVKVAVDPVGNLLLADGGTVWMVAEQAGSYYGKAMNAGDVYTVALAGAQWQPLGDGGPAIGAVFDAAGIAVGPAGSLLIADDLTGRVRSVSR